VVQNTPANSTMAKAKSSKRIIMRVDVTPLARDGLNSVCEEYGITHVAAMSRLIEWFSKESDVVQCGVLNLYPRDMRDKVAKIVLRQIAAEGKNSRKNKSKTTIHAPQDS
jgi:hypothetical protein